MITPLDVQNQIFKKSFRGYNEEEVKDFLDTLARDYEHLYRENAEIKEANKHLKTKLEEFQRLETTLYQTLVIAQETADEVKKNAQRQAQLIIREAQAEGQQQLDDMQRTIKQKEVEYKMVCRQLQVYVTKARTLLKSQLELLDLSDMEEDKEIQEELEKTKIIIND